MLMAFLDADLWPILENPPPEVQIHLLRAERSAGWSPADLERLARLEERGQVHGHLLRDAGHWVHVGQSGRTVRDPFDQPRQPGLKRARRRIPYAPWCRGSRIRASQPEIAGKRVSDASGRERRERNAR
jgi:hypothetical protein